METEEKIIVRENDVVIFNGDLGDAVLLLLKLQERVEKLERRLGISNS